MLGRKHKRILLLDDDPSMQRLVRSLLEGEGYRAEVFLTGFRDYAVLLLDLMMPHEGGMTVTLRALADRK